jgi:hypothetical protein
MVESTATVIEAPVMNVNLAGVKTKLTIILFGNNTFSALHISHSSHTFKCVGELKALMSSSGSISKNVFKTRSLRLTVQILSLYVSIHWDHYVTGP